MYSAIDIALDKLEKQTKELEKYHQFKKEITKATKGILNTITGLVKNILKDMDKKNNINMEKMGKSLMKVTNQLDKLTELREFDIKVKSI